jgi:hypothetical protein
MIVVTAAAWMFEQIKRQDELRLEDAVIEIGRRFGAQCLGVGAAGKLAPAPAVLKALRLLSGNAVAWDPSGQVWRLQGSAGNTIH